MDWLTDKSYQRMVWLSVMYQRMTHLTSRKQHCCGNSLLGDGIVQGKSFAMALLRESMFCDGIAQGKNVLVWHCSGKVCFVMALLRKSMFSHGIAQWWHCSPLCTREWYDEEGWQPPHTSAPDSPPLSHCCPPPSGQPRRFLHQVHLKNIHILQGRFVKRFSL